MSTSSLILQNKRKKGSVLNLVIVLNYLLLSSGAFSQYRHWRVVSRFLVSFPCGHESIAHTTVRGNSLFSVVGQKDCEYLQGLARRTRASSWCTCSVRSTASWRRRARARRPCCTVDPPTSPSTSSPVSVLAALIVTERKVWPPRCRVVSSRTAWCRRSRHRLRLRSNQCGSRIPRKNE